MYLIIYLIIASGFLVFIKKTNTAVLGLCPFFVSFSPVFSHASVSRSCNDLGKRMMHNFTAGKAFHSETGLCYMSAAQQLNTFRSTRSTFVTYY